MRDITRAAYDGDIVSRLRNWRGRHLAHSGDLFEEAADEIERLRQQRNHWMAAARAFDEHLATMRVMFMEHPTIRFGLESARTEVIPLHGPATEPYDIDGDS